jgi:osmoprotectant transport system substrate-binding protein
LIRKHTRRAVKASFAVAFGVAIVLGGFAASASSAGPTVVIGTKNFGEEYVLGQLYKQALEAKGFKVSYKENIGSTEIIQSALTSGKINFYPEYTGIIISVVFHKNVSPPSAAATFALAKKLEESKGFTLLAQTPFQDRDVLGVLTATAKKDGLKTISDLSKVSGLSICGFPEWDKRWTGPIKKDYGVSGFTFVPLSGISGYAALDAKRCTAADVFSTDPPLLGTKYTVLADPKNMFGFQNVAPIVSKKVAAALGPKFAQTVNAVSSKLTLPAVLAMNKAVYVDKIAPAKIADGFLKANGLK